MQFCLFISSSELQALSSSPISNLSSRTVGRRASGLGLSGRRPEKLSLTEGDFIASTPISTYVRRKTPQNSPITPTFPHRKRSSSPSAPLLIPTLPTFIFPQLPTIDSVSKQSTDAEDDPMDISSSTAAHYNPSHAKLKVSRRSEASISLGLSSSPLDPAPLEAHRLTPVA